MHTIIEFAWTSREIYQQYCLATSFKGATDLQNAKMLEQHPTVDIPLDSGISFCKTIFSSNDLSMILMGV